MEKLGFEKRPDLAYRGGHRWIEVAPPAAANTIALVLPTEGASAGGDVARRAFATADIEADHAALRARGVDVDAEIAGTGTARSGLVSNAVSIADPVPAQFFLRRPGREPWSSSRADVPAARRAPAPLMRGAAHRLAGLPPDSPTAVAAAASRRTAMQTASPHCELAHNPRTWRGGALGVDAGMNADYLQGCGWARGLGMSHGSVRRRREVVVVGGGQAGLAIGYFLAREARDFTTWKRPPNRRLSGASAGTRSSCSRRSATTACPAYPSPATRIAIPAATRSRRPDRLLPLLRAAGGAR